MKPSVAHAGAFNVKDLGHQIRSRPAIIPPSSPPSYSPEGKCKLVGLDTSSSASLSSPLKLDRNVLHTTSTSGVVLSSPITNLSHFSYKAENGSKGKGKGKLQQQVQREHKSAVVGNKNQRENHELSPVNAEADPIKSHYDLGLVQSEPYGGMESHLPSNSQEQEKGVLALGGPGLAGLGKPLVAIPNGHSIKGGR